MFFKFFQRHGSSRFEKFYIWKAVGEIIKQTNKQKTHADGFMLVDLGINTVVVQVEASSVVSPLHQNPNMAKINHFQYDFAPSETHFSPLMHPTIFLVPPLNKHHCRKSELLKVHVVRVC